MDVVRHLSDGEMFIVKMREIDLGGCKCNSQSPAAQCYIDQRTTRRRHALGELSVYQS